MLGNGITLLRRALAPITVTAEAGVLATALFSATAFGLATLSLPFLMGVRGRWA